MGVGVGGEASVQLNPDDEHVHDETPLLPLKAKLLPPQRLRQAAEVRILLLRHVRSEGGGVGAGVGVGVGVGVVGVGQA